METLRNALNEATQIVIHPIKFKYNINSLIPSQQNIAGLIFQRIDLSVKNDQGKCISAMIVKVKEKRGRCNGGIGAVKHAIMYFHGNGGTKAEIFGIVSELNQQTAVIAFDFVGCGNSDEGMLSYGLKEALDAEIVLREAYKYIDIQKLTIWGRSMGAATAIMFANRNPKIIDKIVLDGAFRKLSSVVKRVIQNQSHLPQTLINILFYFLRTRIESQLGLPLFQHDYIAHFKKLPRTVNVLLLYSINDNVVLKKDVLEFMHAARSQCEVMEILESHDSDRSKIVYKDVLNWIRRNQPTRACGLKLLMKIQTPRYQYQSNEVHSFC